MHELSVHRNHTPPTRMLGRGIDLTLPREMEWDLFGGLTHFREGSLHGPSPALEVRETPTAFVVTLDVPGVQEADLDLALTETRLQVHGRRDMAPREEGEVLRHSEPAYGEFNRSFEIPEIAADKVHAELESGVLRITLPKAPGTHSRKVEVGHASQLPGSGF
ncbi:MAG TPA: Hsp20/alpha crystallin family protein [Holophagaceae bacterium]|nr:Hsp20/alpha crystallin family protein [Holophagaceae bacterium]